MLKSCILPINYTNFTNKSCGEIICQTETTFTIVCKLCNIKQFEYDEFIQHFRITHWPEVCNRLNQRNTNTLSKDSEVPDWVRNEDRIDGTEVNNKEQKILQNFIEKKSKEGFSNDNGDELAESDTCLERANEEDSDSDDSTKPLTILKKASHTTDATKKKRFECEECKRKFTTKFYLRFHIRQQHEPKNFQCDKCNKSFVEKRYLTLHQRSHNGYTCRTCDKIFDKYEALRYHTESHIESRNFICDYENCGKAFPNNRRLSAHKRSHLVQPSYVCEICGSRQRSKEFLIVHIRTHTGEKPYACNHCDRKFASKHFLQDHQAVHATERSHICTVCSKAFASSKSLYHHRHLHSGVKKFVCKICNSAYMQAAGLSAHMRKHKQDSGLLETDQTVGNIFC